MMKAWLGLTVALFFVTLSLPAFGETTGNDVLNSCQTAIRYVDNNGEFTSEHFDSGWCVGWIAGALQLTKLHNEWTGLTKQKPTLVQFCVPDPGIPVIQAARVVVKYMKAHPEQLHEDGMGLTIAPLRDSFPCK
jgi:hypothetical protein